MSTRPTEEHYHLLASLRSPFARRIRIALKRLQFKHTQFKHTQFKHTQFKHTVEFLNVFERNEKLLQWNPLGLVPTLKTPQGVILTDSAAILEYLHDLTGCIWPGPVEDRAKMRQVSTWCEGVMQNCVSYYIETHEHPTPDLSWAKEYEENVLATLKHLQELPENHCSQGLWTPSQQSFWDLGVALQYVSLRLPHLHWEKQFLKLSEIFKCIQAEKVFQDTVPPPAN